MQWLKWLWPFIFYLHCSSQLGMQLRMWKGKFEQTVAKILPIYSGGFNRKRGGKIADINICDAWCTGLLNSYTNQAAYREWKWQNESEKSKQKACGSLSVKTEITRLKQRGKAWATEELAREGRIGRKIDLVRLKYILGRGKCHYCVCCFFKAFSRIYWKTFKDPLIGDPKRHSVFRKIKCAFKQEFEHT